MRTGSDTNTTTTPCSFQTHAPCIPNQSTSPNTHHATSHMGSNQQQPPLSTVSSHDWTDFMGSAPQQQASSTAAGGGGDWGERDPFATVPGIEDRGQGNAHAQQQDRGGVSVGRTQTMQAPLPSGLSGLHPQTSTESYGRHASAKSADEVRLAMMLYWWDVISKRCVFAACWSMVTTNCGCH